MLIVLISMFMLHAVYLEIKLSRSFKTVAFLIKHEKPDSYQNILTEKIDNNFSVLCASLARIYEKLEELDSSLKAIDEEILALGRSKEKEVGSREERYKNMRKAFGGSEEEE